MRVLVAGGTGFIGRAMVEALRDRGDEVVVATRNPREPGEVSYDQLPRSIDAVINLAGEGVAGHWTRSKKRAILESRVETTRRIVDWMLDMPGRMPTLLNASAVGIYGNRPGEVLSEDSVQDPLDRFRAQVCRAWEAEADRAREFGARVVLLRIGGVLDPSGGLVGIASRLLRPAPFAIAPPPHVKVPWISLEDAVRLILFALDHPEVSGPLNVTAPVATTYGHLTTELARRSSRLVLADAPTWLVRAVLGECSEAITDSQEIRPCEALRHGFVFHHPRFEDWAREQRG